MIDFRLRGYQNLLSWLQEEGYDFRRLDEPATEKTVYLRHDVDHSTIMAKKLAVIEKSEGIRSSYFFMVNADAFHFFGDQTLELMEQLQEQGHLVGLHLDERLFGTREEDLERTIRWFSETVVSVSNVFSFHRPTNEVLGREYDGITSAYSPELFDVTRYASDSRRRSDFKPQLEKMVDEEKSPIQLLLHPAWWCGEDSLASIGWMIASRREYEVRKHLLDDWEAVFKGVLPPGNGEEIV